MFLRVRGREKRKKMAVPGFCRSVVLISPGLKKCMISHRKNFLIYGASGGSGHGENTGGGRKMENGVGLSETGDFCGGRSLCV